MTPKRRSRKPFYGANKTEDTVKFNKAITDLSTLYGDANAKRKLADELKVSPSTLRRWETGKSKPRDFEKFESVLNKHTALKPTIKNHDRREKFIERKSPNKKKLKKGITGGPKIKHEKIIVEDIETWFQKHHHERYKNVEKYDYLRNMLREHGFKYAKYLSTNSYEAMFLRTPDEYIMGKTFMYMVGVTVAYPFNDTARRILIRRLPRLAKLIQENPEGDSPEAIKVMIDNTDKARDTFYSGDGIHNKIENFFGYYFE